MATVPTVLGDIKAGDVTYHLSSENQSRVVSVSQQANQPTGSFRLFFPQALWSVSLLSHIRLMKFIYHPLQPRPTGNCARGPVRGPGRMPQGSSPLVYPLLVFSVLRCAFYEFDSDAATNGFFSPSTLDVPPVEQRDCAAGQ